MVTRSQGRFRTLFIKGRLHASESPARGAQQLARPRRYDLPLSKTLQRVLGRAWESCSICRKEDRSACPPAESMCFPSLSLPFGQKAVTQRGADHEKVAGSAQTESSRTVPSGYTRTGE